MKAALLTAGAMPTKVLPLLAQPPAVLVDSNSSVVTFCDGRMVIDSARASSPLKAERSIKATPSDEFGIHLDVLQRHINTLQDSHRTLNEELQAEQAARIALEARLTSDLQKIVSLVNDRTGEIVSLVTSAAACNLQNGGTMSDSIIAGSKRWSDATCIGPEPQEYGVGRCSVATCIGPAPDESDKPTLPDAWDAAEAAWGLETDEVHNNSKAPNKSPLDILHLSDNLVLPAASLRQDALCPDRGLSKSAMSVCDNVQSLPDLLLSVSSPCRKGSKRGSEGGRSHLSDRLAPSPRMLSPRSSMSPKRGPLRAAYRCPRSESSAASFPLPLRTPPPERPPIGAPTAPSVVAAATFAALTPREDGEDLRGIVRQSSHALFAPTCHPGRPTLAPEEAAAVVRAVTWDGCGEASGDGGDRASSSLWDPQGLEVPESLRRAQGLLAQLYPSPTAPHQLLGSAPNLGSTNPKPIFSSAPCLRPPPPPLLQRPPMEDCRQCSSPIVPKRSRTSDPFHVGGCGMTPTTPALRT